MLRVERLKLPAWRMTASNAFSHRSLRAASDQSSKTSTGSSCCEKNGAFGRSNKVGFEDKEHPPSPAPLDADFWKDRKIWIQAATNTTRCLIGCSTGDLSMLFITQSYGFSMPASMALSMASGLSTSFALETLWLIRFNGMTLGKAAETAFGMSMISMLSMEAAENIVDLALTGGQFAPSEPWWWGALSVSLGAGFLTPLPYNYYMLKKHGRSCH